MFLQQLFDHNRRFNGVEKIQISRPNSKGVGEFFRLRLLKVSNDVFVLILFGAQTNFANFFSELCSIRIFRPVKIQKMYRSEML